MSSDKIEWGKEIVQAGSDIAELSKDAGLPGVGLIARFAQLFYDKHLQRRFERFVSEAEINQELIDKIISDETYSNCFYAVLETVRQTHSRIGLGALALIYHDRWDDESYLIGAMYSFSQISDKTIEAFLLLYESIPEGQNYISLEMHKNGYCHFHDLYNEAVELIRRNFFVMTSGVKVYANYPAQGMKWAHSESYYQYCQNAKARV
jgi:hypothetical protein